ncbi:MAG: phage portal protein [Deltaproteobacteria bacterium]|nr:phage portal protein [Deltaproteobacteria bacterium]
MTREELEKRHQDYEAWIEEWRFYVRSYLGGKVYKDGDYLLQHPFESAANYRRRKEISYYYNYCGPIVDILVSHLFRREARREFGSLSGDPLFQSFLNDADFDGSTLKHFMREAQRLACLYGRVSIMVDKSAAPVATSLEAIDRDVRPYVTIVTPEHMLDWEYARQPSGKSELSMVKIKEDGGACRIWTTQGWELWEADKSGGVRLRDAGEHGLGVVPVVNLYNKRTGIRMIGASDLQDIADINKNIYYLCSDAKEIIENTAFPMLAVPYEKGGSEEMKQLGPRNILQFDPAEPNARPMWLEPPHSSLTEIREWVRQDITEIHRIAKMGGVKASEDFTAVKSGVALELEYQQLYSALSEKADNLEHAEAQILRLWAAWEGKVFDGQIDYPDDFSARDIDRDIENAIKTLAARIDSLTFRRELQKKIASSALPKLDEALKTRINGEIDASVTAL